MGRVHFSEVDYWPHNTCLYVTDFFGNNPRFAYYLLQTLDLAAFNSGSAQPSLNRNFIYSMPLRVPARHEQDCIVELLRALDNRIALLRETNATLEAIAQALFKSWFVDFDPVRAKMEGCVPEGMDEATTALFPDGFEDSELGLVPRGWQIGKLGELARQHKGSINPLKNPETLFEHFSLPAFDKHQMPVSELGEEIKSNKTSVPPDAVLLSKLNPHIPRVWLPVDVGRHAVCSTEFLVFVPASSASKEFIYCAFSTPKFQELLCQLVTGTSNSHQRVKPDGVSSMNFVIPGSRVLEAFAVLVKPIFERIGHNRGEAQTLATLRDTLLPRLISGHLRLPEAESLLEEACA
ncbi:restriction endonuclease subunit S [Polaromonas hydrogenivorans]